MRNGLRDSSSKGFVYCDDLNCNVTLFCKEVKKMECLISIQGVNDLLIVDSVNSVQVTEYSYDLYDEEQKLLFSAPIEKVEFIGKSDKIRRP